MGEVYGYLNLFLCIFTSFPSSPHHTRTHTHTLTHTPSHTHTLTHTPTHTHTLTRAPTPSFQAPPEHPHLMSAMWGKLSCAVLMQDWEAALDDLNKLRREIDETVSISTHPFTSTPQSQVPIITRRPQLRY